MALSNLEKKFAIAKEVAKMAPGIHGNGNIKLGAVLFSKTKVVSTGTNSYKTHPAALRYYIYPHAHAEFAAIWKAGFDNCKGLTLVVVRIKINGEIGMSCSCSGCIKLAKDVKLKDIYYHTETGSIGKLRLDSITDSNITRYYNGNPANEVYLKELKKQTLYSF